MSVRADEVEKGDELARETADAVARRSYGKLVAFLAARTHDVTAAEDALSEAFLSALADWPRNGCPANPEGWLLTVARRAGRPADEAQPLPAAGPDPRPAVSPAAGERLARILGGEHPDLLAEWLKAAVARGLRAPAQLLPALLDRGRRAHSHHAIG